MNDARRFARPVLWSICASFAILAAACGSSSATAATDGAVGDRGPTGDALRSGPCSACFAHGQWSIDNLSPCLLTGADQAKVTVAISTIESANQSQCPSDFSAAPTQAWSSDHLTIDCAGHYRLCYTLKAGDPSNPSASDCVVAQSCAEGDATMSSAPQAWPPLPGWIASTSATACAQSFYDGGGYGEESVTGSPNGCGTIGKTFVRVWYCPLACNGPNPPAACANCQSGGSSSF
jgi:hypothetical protein